MDFDGVTNVVERMALVTVISALMSLCATLLIPTYSENIKKTIGIFLLAIIAGWTTLFAHKDYLLGPVIFLVYVIGPSVISILGSKDAENKAGDVFWDFVRKKLGLKKEDTE